MPRIKFITLDFGSSKKRPPIEEPIVPLFNGSNETQQPVLTEDRQKQLLESISPSGLSEIVTRRPLFLMTILLALTAIIGGFSFFRYASLQRENFSLTDEMRKLNQSIVVLEEENKDLALKTERAEKEKMKLQEAVESFKKQNETLQFDATKSETRANSIMEEKTHFEKILINKNKKKKKI